MEYHAILRVVLSQRTKRGSNDLLRKINNKKVIVLKCDKRRVGCTGFLAISVAAKNYRT